MCGSTSEESGGRTVASWCPDLPTSTKRNCVPMPGLKAIMSLTRMVSSLRSCRLRCRGFCRRRRWRRRSKRNVSGPPTRRVLFDGTPASPSRGYRSGPPFATTWAYRAGASMRCLSTRSGGSLHCARGCHQRAPPPQPLMSSTDLAKTCSICRKRGCSPSGGGRGPRL